MFAKKENKKKQNKCEENLIIFEIVYFITIVAFVYGMEKWKPHKVINFVEQLNV